MRTFAAILVAWLAGLILVPAAGPSSATPASAQQIPEGRRYLFVIDTSAGMARCRENTEKTVRNLIASGMNGEMTAGDAFAIWPYRDKVVADAFAPETWLPQVKDQLVGTAGQFVKSLKYEGTSFLYTALVESFKVVRASRVVTVILITDGTETLQGTPFDLYANTIYRDHASKFRKEMKPFVTTLVAVHGKILGCTVGAGGDSITFPQIPDDVKAKLAAEFEAARAAAKPVIAPTPSPPPAHVLPPTKPAAKKPANTTTVAVNSTTTVEALPKPAAAQTTAPAIPAPAPTPVPPAPTPEPQPQEIPKPTKPVVAETSSLSPKVTVSPVATPEPPPPAIPKSTTPTVAETPTPLPKATVATAVPLEPLPPANPQPAKPVVAEAPAPAPKATVAPVVSPEPPPVAPAAPRPSPPAIVPAPVPAASTAPQPAAKVDAMTPAKQLGVVTPAAGFSRNRFLVIGIGLLAVAGLIGWLIFRGSKGSKRPSLISRSMGR